MGARHLLRDYTIHALGANLHVLLAGPQAASASALSHLSLGPVHSAGAGVLVLIERCGEGRGSDFG